MTIEKAEKICMGIGIVLTTCGVASLIALVFVGAAIR